MISFFSSDATTVKIATTLQVSRPCVLILTFLIQSFVQWLMKAYLKAKESYSNDDWLDEYYNNEPIFSETSDMNPIEISIQSLKHQYIYNKAESLTKNKDKRKPDEGVMGNGKEDDHNNIVKALISLFHTILDLQLEAAVEIIKENVILSSFIYLIKYCAKNVSVCKIVFIVITRKLLIKITNLANVTFIFLKKIK